MARVGVQFEIDANGILQVLARDLKTTQERVVAMSSAVDVNDSDVQRMVEESVEHAFTDLRLRRWVETKLRAQDTLGLAKNGLTQAGAALTAEEQTRIDSAIAGLQQALSTEEPPSQIGNLDGLEAGLQELDRATQTLADHLMDRAVEAMLQTKGLALLDRVATHSTGA